MQSLPRRVRTTRAAEIVGLSRSTLEKLRLRGDGPIYEKAGRKIVLYRLEDLEAWMSQGRRTSTSDTGGRS